MNQLKNFLLVDDDCDDSDLLKEVIEDMVPSCLVCVVTNGSDALKQIADFHPDFIFLDINMPVQNGFECLEIIRKKKEYDHLPVAIYSTSGNESQIKKAYDGLANMYIKKPSTFPAIKMIVQKVIEINLNVYVPAPPKFSDFLMG